MTWNCQVGGFARKAQHVAPFLPDVLVVQEMESVDDVVLGGQVQPTFRKRLCRPEPGSRGVGVFSYTTTKLRYVDADLQRGFHRFEAEQNDLGFNVVAVWTSNRTPHATAYRQAHDGLSRHAAWIAARPTVVLGDFNNNASYKRRDWKGLLALMESLGLVSAYHAKTGEPHGAERQPTYFYRGGKFTTQLDYCFVPALWREKITAVQVGTHDQWGALSDHAPLIVELDL